MAGAERVSGLYEGGDASVVDDRRRLVTVGEGSTAEESRSDSDIVDWLEEGDGVSSRPLMSIFAASNA